MGGKQPTTCTRCLANGLSCKFAPLKRPKVVIEADAAEPEQKDNPKDSNRGKKESDIERVGIKQSKVKEVMKSDGKTGNQQLQSAPMPSNKNGKESTSDSVYRKSVIKGASKSLIKHSKKRKRGKEEQDSDGKKAVKEQ